MYLNLKYDIHGNEMQYVQFSLQGGQAIIAEAGSFMMMDDGINMQTLLGDGTEAGGMMGSIMAAGRRLLTGERLFVTRFRNDSGQPKQLAFAAPYPGKIIPIDLAKHKGRLICQKDAFLCATPGTKISVAFSRKLMRGLFGGEGFIMQRLEGNGLAFIHAGGTLSVMELQAGQMIKVDTGCLVGFEESVDYDVKLIGGIRNTLFGGEGLFFATLKGPGRVYLQSLPFSRLAGRVYAAAPQTGGKSRDEGSVLGEFGRMLRGNKY